MKLQVIKCIGCGNSLSVSRSQFLLNCPYCGKKSYLKTPNPPAIALKAEIPGSKCQQLLVNYLQKPGIDRQFARKIKITATNLLYVPFYEAYGNRAGKFIQQQYRTIPLPSFNRFNAISGSAELQPIPQKEIIEKVDFFYNSFYSLSAATTFFDQFPSGFFEEEILSGIQIPFAPEQLRRSAQIIDPNKALPRRTITTDNEHFIEEYLRIIYLPIWKVNYEFQNMPFFAYLSAITGKVLVFSAIKDRRRNLLKSLVGLVCLGVLLGKAINMAMSSPKGVFGETLPAFFLLLVILLALFFLPYFFQLFSAFEELNVSICGIKSNFISEDFSIIKLLKAKQR